LLDRRDRRVDDDELGLGLLRGEAIASTCPEPNKVAAFGERTLNGILSATTMPIASARPAASSSRASVSRRAFVPSSGSATIALAPRLTSPSFSRSKTLRRRTPRHPTL
jgi:hypothetical protein